MKLAEFFLKYFDILKPKNIVDECSPLIIKDLPEKLKEDFLSCKEFQGKEIVLVDQPSFMANDKPMHTATWVLCDPFILDESIKKVYLYSFFFSPKVFSGNVTDLDNGIYKFSRLSGNLTIKNSIIINYSPEELQDNPDFEEKIFKKIQEKLYNSNNDGYRRVMIRLALEEEEEEIKQLANSPKSVLIPDFC